MGGDLVSVGGCSCCEDLPCFSPQIQYRSYSATRSKCGHRAYDDSNKWYLKEEQSRDGNRSTASSSEICACTQTWAIDWTRTSLYNYLTCGSPVVTCAGSERVEATVANCGESENNNGWSQQAWNGSCSGVWSSSGNGGNCQGLCSGVWTSGPVTITSPTTKTQSKSWGSTACPNHTLSGSETETWTLDEEFTNFLLISKTYSALPASPNGTADKALYDLSADEFTATLRRMQYKVTFVPPASCYLKMWFQKLYFNTEGELQEELTENLPPVVWTAPGNPCLNNSNLPPSNSVNIIDQGWNTVEPPAEPGQVMIHLHKWSCVEGYEPPDAETIGGISNANGYEGWNI